MMTPPDTRALTILLVEDNPGDARLIQLMLDAVVGVRVHLVRADRLAAGLQQVSTQTFDAALLDLSLPDSHGLATFSRFQQAAPGLPIVVLSGLADEQVALHAVAAGAQDYLVKGQVESALLGRALGYAIERKRADEERRQLLARAEAAHAAAEQLAAERAAVLGQIADGVLITDPAGAITFVNGAARRLYGVAGADLRVGQPFGMRGLLTTAGAPYPPAELPIARALASGETISDAEWCLRRVSGVLNTIQGSATPVYADDGVLLGAVLTFRDVTAQRDLARQREDFFANASHDLRTPLAAIKASTGVILANEPAGMPPALHRMLTNIEAAAGEMSRLVDDLLELARLEARKAESHPLVSDLGALARRVARAVEPLVLERDQHLTLNIPTRPVLAAIDTPLIERALLNLLGNAQKYGRDGGSIRLDLSAQRDEAIFSVADDGPGISAEDQARIFERFYRPSRTSARVVVGSGLGLPIVRTTAERHGGRAWIESTPGSGSIFRLALPLAPLRTIGDEVPVPVEGAFV